jgi:hypothetical protein
MRRHCMVAHSSDMQDLSHHTIPKHLQDTALPLPLCHYSSIPRSITLESSLSCLINTDRIITIYMHHYCCMVAHSFDMQYPSPHTIPRHLQDTALPSSFAITLILLNAQHWTHHYHAISTPTDSLPHTGTITVTLELLHLHSSTSGSAVSHGYYRQIRLIAVDPDLRLRPRPFLTTLPCTALGYQRLPL